MLSNALFYMGMRVSTVHAVVLGPRSEVDIMLAQCGQCGQSGATTSSLKL